MKRTITPLQIIFSFAASITFLTMAPNSATAGSDPFIGEISYVGFNFAPRGWAKCDGQLLPISQNQTLFSLLGNTYGGDGRTSFGLPDMRGRVPIHQGNSPGGSNFTMGQNGGVEATTLTVNQMPAHNHAATAASTSTSIVAAGATATSTLKAANADVSEKNAAGNSLANATGLGKAYSASAPDVSMHTGSIETSLGGINITTTTDTTVTVENTGGSQSFSIMQPFTTVNCIIALEGIYPSRQ